jgi:acetylornithine/N-succinyldiaminopimelate aminotransferase
VPCFGFEEEPGPDSLGRSVIFPNKWKMILKFLTEIFRKEIYMTGMSTSQLLESAKNHLVYVTDRPPVVMQRGEGMYLFDTEGKRYLDFVGGWAVTALGHCPPVLVKALKEQADVLINCSPAFFNTGMIAFADLLVRHSCFDQAWFGNTGAEVNEAAIKLARKYGALHKKGAFEIITTDHSFHGRTLAMMSATGKPQWASLFEPKAAGFIHVPFNDLGALRKAVSEKTIAIMLEPIQGEGGVNIADPAYMKGIRNLCDEQGIVLIADEVQTGLGRCGTLFAYQQYGVEPDIMTLAKGIGAGYPLAAVLAKKKFCLFAAGDHGGTYGGNSLGMAVGIAVVEEIIKRDLSSYAVKMGDYIEERLKAESSRFNLTNIRGRGLLLAFDLPREAGKEIVGKTLGKGLLLNSPQPASIRLMPPLIVEKEHVDEMMTILKATLEEVLA